MLVINYSDSNFEEIALQAIKSKQEFSINIRAWQRKPITRGLNYYNQYRNGKRNISLMLIPYVFFTPTFWVVCVKSEFENFMPSWVNEEHELIVRFAKINNTK